MGRHARGGSMLTGGDVLAFLCMGGIVPWEFLWTWQTIEISMKQNECCWRHCLDTCSLMHVHTPDLLWGDTTPTQAIVLQCTRQRYWRDSTPGQHCGISEMLNLKKVWCQNDCQWSRFTVGSVWVHARSCMSRCHISSGYTVHTVHAFCSTGKTNGGWWHVEPVQLLLRWVTGLLLALLGFVITDACPIVGITHGMLQVWTPCTALVGFTHAVLWISHLDWIVSS